MTEHKCSKCKKTFELHPDLEPKKIGRKIYCKECYYDVCGAFIEKHPIGLPHR